MVKGGSFFENIKLAFQGIFSHKLRSFLTMLGVIIGIASIIAIVSTIKGTNEQIKANLIGSGTNIIQISPYQGDYRYEFDYQQIPDGFYPVSDETIEEISGLNNVLAVSRVLSRNYIEVSCGDKQLSGANLYGVEECCFSALGLQVVEGRLFIEKDYETFPKICIIDKTIAKNMFANESVVGKYLEIYGEVFTIVGLVDEKKAFEPNIQNISDYYTYIGNGGGTIYVPINVWPIIQKFDEPEQVFIKCSSTDVMTSIGKKAANILNDALGLGEEGSNANEVRYKANDLLEQAKQMQELSNSTNAMLVWIAGISLLVGGIGVMNIMLVSVTERTREIGLKKALGARKKRILIQFLTEAAVLTSVGGILGVLVGIILAYVIRFIASVPVAISVPAILVSVIFSAVVGIVFGLIPSIKAANLDPIEALRYE